MPAPSGDQVAAGVELKVLTVPVTNELLAAGVDPMSAAFVAYRIVSGVLTAVGSDLISRYEL